MSPKQVNSKIRKSVESAVTTPESCTTQKTSVPPEYKLENIMKFGVNSYIPKVKFSPKNRNLTSLKKKKSKFIVYL